MSTNGLGEPRYPVNQVLPGCIARFGVDDDMTVMVLANFPTTNGPQNGNKPRQRLVFYGSFCDERGSWEEGRVFHQDHDLKDTLTVIRVPEYN